MAVTLALPVDATLSSASRAALVTALAEPNADASGTSMVSATTATAAEGEARTSERAPRGGCLMTFRTQVARRRTRAHRTRHDEVLLLVAQLDERGRCSRSARRAYRGVPLRVASMLDVNGARRITKSTPSRDPFFGPLWRFP